VKKSNKSINVDKNKRDFVKKAAYAAPVIMTMAAAPSFAGTGSGWQQETPPAAASSSVQGATRGVTRDGRSRGVTRDGRSRS